MTLNEKDFELFKKWLQSHLKCGAVTVTFTKKDGEERVMSCTTSASLVPPATEGVEPKREKKKNNDICNVYALDVNAWRSFRWDSIKNVTFTLGEDLEHSNKVQ